MASIALASGAATSRRDADFVSDQMALNGLDEVNMASPFGQAVARRAGAVVKAVSEKLRNCTGSKYRENLKKNKLNLRTKNDKQFEMGNLSGNLMRKAITNTPMAMKIERNRETFGTSA